MRCSAASAGAVFGFGVRAFTLVSDIGGIGVRQLDLVPATFISELQNGDNHRRAHRAHLGGCFCFCYWETWDFFSGRFGVSKREWERQEKIERTTTSCSWFTWWWEVDFLCSSFLLSSLSYTFLTGPARAVRHILIFRAFSPQRSPSPPLIPRCDIFLSSSSSSFLTVSFTACSAYFM